MNIPKPKTTNAWALPEKGFAEGLVGGKSLHLATLRAALPKGIAVPSSVALPFGTFERVLADNANAAAAAKVAEDQKKLVRVLVKKPYAGLPRLHRSPLCQGPD